MTDCSPIKSTGKLTNIITTPGRSRILLQGREIFHQMFYCGFGLQDWCCSDEPWMDHAYLSLHCKFILGNKNKKWIHQAFNARARLVDEGSSVKLSCQGSSVYPEIAHCLEWNLRIASLPSRHLCACAMSVPGLKHCHMCKHDVTDIVCIFNF
jgi:hypothetical protein